MVIFKYVSLLTKVVVLCLLVGMNKTNAEPIEVKVTKTGNRYILVRDQKPYFIKGAGIGSADLTQFASHGGNSFRTWTVEHGPIPTAQLLDNAQALGLTVSLGLEFGRERQGFDYDDPIAVAKQFEDTQAKVEKYKDHPALLTWFIGNELNLQFKNPKVYDAVGQVAAMIKKIDPKHPVTTTLAGFDERAIKEIQQRAPDIDFISFQLYADLVNLPKNLSRIGFDSPYFITEWGAFGHWEVGKTEWGAPIENSSSEKASHYATSYLNVISKDADHIIGNYVFLWGQKQEKTPTWYGMFLDTGENTEAVDIMHYIWNGTWPANRAPRMGPIKLNKRNAADNVHLFSGKTYKASVSVTDPDGDTLSYKWEVRKESSATQVGGDKEDIPPIIEGLIKSTRAATAKIIAPEEKGAYRLFVYAYDGKNNAAHANIPFLVK